MTQTSECIRAQFTVIMKSKLLITIFNSWCTLHGYRILSLVEFYHIYPRSAKLDSLVKKFVVSPIYEVKYKHQMILINIRSTHLKMSNQNNRFHGVIDPEIHSSVKSNSHY